jgi:hypothetical protein
MRGQIFYKWLAYVDLLQCKTIVFACKLYHLGAWSKNEKQMAEEEENERLRHY